MARAGQRRHQRRTRATSIASAASSGYIAQPFVEARMVDADGNDTAPGQVEELVFRGEAITKGGQPKATGEAIRGGCLHTGDLMQVYNNGAMRLVDRLKDVIVTGGRSVYSTEVEQAIGDHPGVEDVTVVGRPYLGWGEPLAALVAVSAGADCTAESIGGTAVLGSRITKFPANSCLLPSRAIAPGRPKSMCCEPRSTSVMCVCARKHRRLPTSTRY
jgi:acyl-CoA synthetase (AMP-forming)/AMP-acid ligase II